jgi:hypothetical protein
VTAPIRSDQPWLAPFLALAVMWGASFLCIKVALDDLDPIGIVLGRILLPRRSSRCSPCAASGSRAAGCGCTSRCSR